tara:strand:- start:337 stop:540 length:204 start_codon:yes stop_codon:yes gene_type:complete
MDQASPALLLHQHLCYPEGIPGSKRRVITFPLERPVLNIVQKENMDQQFYGNAPTIIYKIIEILERS